MTDFSISLGEWNWGLLYLASEWLIRVIMLAWVPQRRSADGARTWLLFIFLLPWLGLIAYIALGRVYLPQRRQELQARASAGIHAVQAQWQLHRPPFKADTPPQLRQAVTLARNLGEFDILDGNQVELLDDYEATLASLIADIDGARHHVHLQFYMFAADVTGRRVADAVVRAAGRGVHCRVLMDGVGARDGLEQLAPALRSAGVEVVALLPVGLFRRKAARFDLRNHRKLVIVDGRIGYIGSQNIINADAEPGLINEELVARLQGPVVAQLQVTFLADHYFEVETPFTTADLFPPLERVGASAAQLLPSGPGYQRTNAQHLLVALIHDAHFRIVITTPYFIPDEAFLQALQTAVLSGVEVHLVVPSQIDHRIVEWAQQSYYEALLEAGVTIHLYRPRFLHAKHVSVDDTIAFIGSTNMDLRSFGLNAEASLLIYDPAVVRELRTIQERYFADSEQLTAEAWARRPLARKIVQNTARLADALL